MNDDAIANFQPEFAKVGYKFHCVTLAGFHTRIPKVTTETGNGGSSANRSSKSPTGMARRRRQAPLKTPTLVMEVTARSENDKENVRRGSELFTRAAKNAERSRGDKALKIFSLLYGMTFTVEVIAVFVADAGRSPSITLSQLRVRPLPPTRGVVSGVVQEKQV